jgi:catalase
MAGKILTTDPEVPFADKQNSLTAGQHGPALLLNVQLIEKQEMVV